MGLVWQRTLGASSDLPWVGAREQCRREIFAGGFLQRFTNEQTISSFDLQQILLAELS